MNTLGSISHMKPFTADDLRKALEAIEPLLPPKILASKLVPRGSLYSMKNDLTKAYEYFCHPDDLDRIIETRAWLALNEKMKKAGA